MRVTGPILVPENEALVHCDICDKVSRKYLKAHAIKAELLSFVCLPCARRIGKAAEEKR